ncbi:SCO family protein [Robiginitomaculum antarcticum]|uniref:SCO family protein n=1 Tax=Robiginitomaculum antarcticum TaxID=437507 RepID=UPI000366F266|nr:SCO family protein [Robiginitomaculum antarcticum]
MKTVFILSALLSLAVLPACQPETPVARSGPVVSSGTAQVGGPFTLVNGAGETVTDKDFLGQPQLIYFGFTYCPDVCPMGLQQMGAATDLLGRDAEKLQTILISLDPERDTPGIMAQYVTGNGFPDNLIGLTGSVEQVDTAKAAFKVYAKKVSMGADTDDYTVDHSSLMYLMDKDGKFAAFFTKDDSPETIAKRIKPYLK